MMHDPHLDPPGNGLGNGHKGRERTRASAHDDLLVAFTRLRGRVPELQRHLLAYASVQIDRARLSLRRLVLWCVVAVIGGVALLAATVTAAIMLAAGVGETLAALLGGRAWLGNLLGGLALLGLLAAAIALAYGRRRRRDWDRLLRRYGSPTPAGPRGPAHVELEAQGPEL